MKMKKMIYLCMLLLAGRAAHAQTYTPIAVTGYTHDFVAETFPNALVATDSVLDGSNNVMYSQSFATAGGFQGGLPTNGIITDAGNVRQWQLAPYNGPNMLNAMRNVSRAFTLVTPAAYQKLSVLAFSTEGTSGVTVIVEFTDGTSTTYLTNYQLPDWFNNTTNVAVQGFGRVSRNATTTAVDGPSTNPRAYYIDITLNCTDKKKPIQAVRFNNVTTTGTNAPFPNTVVLAIAGQADTQAITSSTTPATCGAANGSATVGATGNSGPYTFSWNTTPVQTGATINNLAPGTYIATVTDGTGCTTTRSVTVAQVTPPVVTATAAPQTLCSGGSTQLSVTATGGTLATYTWLPGGATTSTVTVTPATTTTYSVVGLDAAGCPYTKLVTVVVNQRPLAPVVPNVLYCQGSTGAIQVQGPQAGYTYNWYSSATGGTILATGPSFPLNNVTTNLNYYVEAVSSGCSSTSRTPVSVTLLPSPTVNAGPDQTIIAGDITTLNGTGTIGSTYLWTPGTALSSTSVLNPTANPSTTTTYTLHVTNPQGCEKTDDVVITVLPYCIKPMEAFTPNGDGINDLWRISDGNCLEFARVSVFNRYGSLVYESNDYKNTWNGTYNGKPLPDGTYYFIITYKLVTGRQVFMKGNVTILR